VIDELDEETKTRTVLRDLEQLGDRIEPDRFAGAPRSGRA
jgi:hypothetical protein